MHTVRHAFTLVEILIVVVILGILAAIVVPQFVGAQEEAAIGTTTYELEKLRRAIDVYMARNDFEVPPVTAGDGTWGPLTAGNGEYLKGAPQNPYVGGVNSRVIIIGNAPDGAYQTTHAWIFDDTTGDVWAGSFDANDDPLPRP